MTAQLASGVLLSVAVVALAVLSAPWLGSMHPADALLIGLLWVCLTLTFEFGFGLLVQRKSLAATLLAAYTFKDANLWPVVVVVTGLAPLVAARIRGLSNKAISRNSEFTLLVLRHPRARALAQLYASTLSFAASFDISTLFATSAAPGPMRIRAPRLRHRFAIQHDRRDATVPCRALG